jgi:glycerol-3-phosphate dehydrogenase (NAD(P)+)
MKPGSQIAVIGGGSWATAIVKMLCNNVEQTHWWVRNATVVEHIKKYKHNPNYLTSVEFDTDKLKRS